MKRALFPLLAVLVVGCGGEPTATTNSPGGKTPAGGSVGEVAVAAVTPAELDKAIAGHKGKVVMIDCWFLG